jgi:hypothetical protein
MSPLEQDALPAALIEDPEHPRRHLAFAGFIGASHLVGHTRLYLDEELREWFDVADDDIRHVERLEGGTTPRTVIWVDQRTTLQRRVPQDEAVQSEYLRGDVSADTVPQSAMSVALDTTVFRRTPAKSLIMC